MHHVVCYSGGHSSALVAIEVARRYGPENVTLVNHQIHPRAEDQDVQRFKEEVARYLGLSIAYASHPRWDSMDQFDIVREARAFKYANGRELCTSRLKTEPFMAWLKTYAPPGSAVICYGFDAHERDRIQRRSSILGAAGYETAYPLAYWPRTIQSTREIGIEPPLTYGQFKHANCVGCLKAGKQHWYIVFCTRPDIWQRAKDAEEDIGYTIHDGTSLEELEPLFTAMREVGVVATEHVPHQTFWADAKRRVRLPVVRDEAEAQLSLNFGKPCECVYKRPAAPRRVAHVLPPCSCGAAPGEGHALVCARVMGERWAA